jgi:hypothetical protein
MEAETKIGLVELRLRRLAINAARVRTGNADVLLPAPDVLVSWADELAETAAALDRYVPTWRKLRGVNLSPDNRLHAGRKLRRAGDGGSGLRETPRREAPT